MRVKIIAAALMTTMLLGSMPTKAEELQLADSVNYGLGQKPEITVEVLDEGIKKPVKKNTKGLKSSENTSLPKNYDSTALGYVTPVRAQGKFGTCWAFTTIAAAESSMLRRGYADLDEIDYSERHLACIAHKHNEILNDGEEFKNDYTGYYCDGNHASAVRYLAGWQGVELEENYPYGETLADMEDVSEDKRYSSYAHLQEYRELESADDVKSAIMENGSVMVEYFADNTKLSNKNAYFSSLGKRYGNHAVVLVGWDDDYAVTNFNGLSPKPQNPGAWKAKNSWGTAWGDNGYFWISYEEATLADFMSLKMEPSDNYNIINQYDGASWSKLLGVEHSANIFTARENQTVKAVGFYTDHASNATEPVTYTAKIYKLDDGAAAPDDGTLMNTVSGTVYYDGYHTAKLTTPVALNSGERFSVVLSLKDPDSTNAFHVFEGTTPSLKNSSNEGESFLYANGTWSDASDGYNNACIKAYSTSEEFTVSFDTGGGDVIASAEYPENAYLTVPKNPTKSGKYFAGWYKDSGCTDMWDFDADTVASDMTLFAKWAEEPILLENLEISASKDAIIVGDELKIKVKKEPYYATNDELLWTLSSDAASFANGVLKGKKKGECILTANAADNSGKTASLTVNVYNPVSNIKFNMTKPVFKTSDAINYYATGNDVKYYNLRIMTPSNNYIVRNISPDTCQNGFGVKITYGTGEYTAYFIAYDYAGNQYMSEKKTFWVSDNPMMVARQTNVGYYVGGFNGDGKIVAARFSDGKLIDVSSFDADGNMKGIESDTANETVKLMWLDSYGGMKPVTASISTDGFTGETYTAE